MDHPELPLWESKEQGAWGRETMTTEALAPDAMPRAPSPFTDPIPARMLNEFVYCQRLFYYEFVDGVFVENADTERGSAIHEKVDRGRGDLPKASRKKQAAKGTEPGETALNQGAVLPLEDEQGEPVQVDRSESESIAPEAGSNSEQRTEKEEPPSDLRASRIQYPATRDRHHSLSLRPRSAPSAWAWWRRWTLWR